MAETHPNAYHAEAEEKRKQAALLANEANDLEAKARELEEAQSDSTTATSQVVEEPKQEETTEKSGNKLFQKK